MDKSEHTVTVPRRYLEELEAIEEAYRNNIPKIWVSNEMPDSNMRYSKILFLLEEDNKYASVGAVIVVDKEGREKRVFTPRFDN